MSERSQVTVRLDPELLAKISQAAASDRRPVSQYVRNLILDAVDGNRGVLDASNTRALNR